MANLVEKKDRHLIPNWRSFQNTANLGELNGSKEIQLNSTFRPDISDLIEDWKEFPSIGVVGDLLGSALICNQEENSIVREVSKSVIQSQTSFPKAIVEAANNILKPRDQEIKINFDLSSENFKNFNIAEIYSKINVYKKKLITNPFNAINWVEIARLYSILGQEKRAHRAIRNAYYLAPENRFVLRSIARFLVHIGEEDAAHDLIRKSSLTKNDPWLLATEISLASLRGRGSIFAKVGLQLLEKGNFHPFNITELAGSLASLEMENASLKKSKKLFERSLQTPNDNSLAQAEWASQKEKNLVPINPESFKVINPFEALAREFEEQKKWVKAIEYALKWFIDMPFAKSSILFGYDIAAQKLKDYAMAVEIAKAGLLSHPNDAHLLNNIIYCLCLQNKVDEAEDYFKKIKTEDLNAKNVTGMCLTATRGLFAFRKGHPSIGRQLYMEAMSMARDFNSYFYQSLALINFVSEEIRIGEEDISEYIPRITQISKQYEGQDISDAAKEVIEVYKININDKF